MLDAMNIGLILRRALAGGGEFADIYYEEGDATVISVEDGKIERVLATTDRGVGIRVISDFRTAYAYSNEINETALLALAETVSHAVKGGAFDLPIVVGTKVTGAEFPIDIPPGSRRGFRIRSVSPRLPQQPPGPRKGCRCGCTR